MMKETRTSWVLTSDRHLPFCDVQCFQNMSCETSQRCAMYLANPEKNFQRRLKRPEIMFFTQKQTVDTHHKSIFVCVRAADTHH
jgi:hypothetical protein